MTATKYTYSLQTDFSNHKVNSDRLTAEIASSTIVTALDRIDTEGDVCDVWFKDALDVATEAILVAIVAAHDGTPTPAARIEADGSAVVNLPLRQVDGVPFIALRSRFGKEVIYTTHSFCDPTTWYSESERIEDKVLTQNGTAWESGDASWIDLDHGKVFDEDAIKIDQGIFSPPAHGYAIVVTVDGVTKTPRVPFGTNGGDYTIDYTSGSVTPVSEDWTGADVRASYSKAVGSAWYVAPTNGRILVVEHAEVQFSKDIDFNGTFKMEVYGYADYFAPQLGLPAGTRIPIELTLYKTIDQLIDEAVGSFPEIPALSTSSPRGYAQPRHIFQFRYGSARSIWSSLGMQIRISIVGDVPFGGERATATFYCLSKTDTGPATGLTILTTGE